MDIQELYTIYKQHPCITTDSRDCPAGSIFLALKGESFDGNKFASMALDKGCAYAIVDEPEYATDERCLLVSDCLQTFKDLAREHRRQFDIPVVGITGTNGKTTTKELTNAVLSEKYNVMCTQGNFNNDVGVPKTLFRLNADHEIAIVEMGASHPGDIKTLVETAEPTCGLITNVGRAHLQGFGSFEGVKRTKGELYDFLTAHDGLLFLNEGNADLVEMADQRQFNRVVAYEKTEDNNIVCNPFLTFDWEGTTIHTHLVGAYNIDNMLAAIAVGQHFGVSHEQIVHALENYIPTNNRSQLERTEHNTLIVDAYNANVSSMKAALDNMQVMQAEHKMAILGDMRELGDASAASHQEIVDLLPQVGLEEVWLVGSELAATDTTATEQTCHVRKFADVEAVKAAIADQQPQGRCILIKGSNGIKLFQLPELL